LTLRKTKSIYWQSDIGEKSIAPKASATARYPSAHVHCRGHRGPEGIIIALTEQLGKKSVTNV
jgi:hypothetical protein